MSDYIENVPESILDSLNRYVKDKIPTGNFLQAVLSNDLMDAIGRADAINRGKLFEICTYVYNELPMNCWGSRKKVDEWLSNKV